MRFTNSPYEKMMQEIPRYERPEPPKAPAGTCYRELLGGAKGRR